MSKLTILLPITFGVMALGTALGIDFYKKQALAGDEDLSVASYVENLTGSLAAQAREVVANRTLVDFLGEAPEGWSKREFTRADMEILTGQPLPEPNEQIPGMNQEGQTMMALAASVSTRGAQKGGNTFEKDGTLVIVQASFLPARIMTGFGGKQMGMMADMMNMANLGDDFAIVRGLKFEEPWDQREKLAYRRFAASLGQQVQLSVLTNAQDDADIMEILGTLDIASMNQMLVEPIPMMGENNILLLASADGGKPANNQAALDAVAETIAAAEEQAALAAAENSSANVAEPELNTSFADRLSGFFSSNTVAEKEELKPKRMVCVMQQGFKRCAFPKED